MLKIKDNVDLEELKKLGFERSHISNTYHKEDEYSFYNYEEKKASEEKYMFGVVINPCVNNDTYKDMKIKNGIVGYFNCHDDSIDEVFKLDALYDLIKADLVEKV